jgi:YidC/Oxa1 family membrane protein insertase
MIKRYNFTKQFKLVPLAFKTGEIDQKMNWYYGPTDYTKVDSRRYVALGWGILD